MSLIKKNYTIKHYLIPANERYPNNEKLPVLLYKQILHIPFILPAYRIKKLLKKNNWYNSWRAGIFTYQHYHSITHEVLAFYKGLTLLLIGGDKGITVNVSAGDLLIIPAGVAHKNLGREHDIVCVGAYPDGRRYDMNYGYEGERPHTDKNIETVPLPEHDPILGLQGEIQNYWK